MIFRLTIHTVVAEQILALYIAIALPNGVKLEATQDMALYEIPCLTDYLMSFATLKATILQSVIHACCVAARHASGV
ncbi:hypothetical protein Q9R34_14035 [Enterobacter sp. BRE11]|nr:hypothetical protein [Enterobacter sp. BRE11]